MNDIEKEIEDLRITRNKLKRKYDIIAITTFLILLIISIICSKLFEIKFIILFFLSTFAMAFIAIYGQIKANNLEVKINSLYKNKIVRKVFEKLFIDVIYIPEKGIEEKILEDTNMIYTGDSYESNDYIKGKYKNINFEFSDVEIEELHKDNDGNTTYVTIFSGQWMIFDFNKPFNYKVSIASKGISLIKNPKNVELEDIDFNKNFSVWSENENEAFYLLTPHLMEKIKKLKNDINSDFILCFINNKLYIGLDNYKDLFEPNINKKINKQKEEEKIIEEVKIITKFIDDLELDNDLFKR